jgi:antirestriction protein ArdC
MYCMERSGPDTRDDLADAFLRSTGGDIREGHGEACYIPSRDFISMPAFAGPRVPIIFTMWHSTS